MDSNFALAENLQQFILEHIGDEDFSVEQICAELHYTSRHLNRVFKQFTGKTISEYCAALRLTQSSYALESGEKVLDTAVNYGYESPEGYAKAFRKQFGKTPAAYRHSGSMIPRFKAYPLRHAYIHAHPAKERTKKMDETIVCTAYLAERPRRKMILLRSKNATEYWSFCEELCCDWEGYLNSNPQKMDTAAIVRLPKSLCKAGYSDIAAGIEVPLTYTNPDLVEGYETVELPPCKMLYFQSQPFPNSNDYGKYIDAVNKAYADFDFSAFGVEVDLSRGPYMNFGAEPERGAKIAYPVREKR